MGYPIETADEGLHEIVRVLERSQRGTGGLAEELDAGLARLARELGQGDEERRLHAQLERLLSKIGETVLDQAESEVGCWRSIAMVESMQELYRDVVVELQDRPTMSDVASGIRALALRADAIRESLSESIGSQEEPSVPRGWS